MKSFPTPIKLRQFLVLISHYRRFIKDYTKIAHPLYALTRKGAIFKWTADCEVAFECLRSKLLTTPVLAYPNLSKDFTLETDVSM